MLENIHKVKTLPSHTIEYAPKTSSSKRRFGSAAHLLKQGLVKETPGWEAPLSEAEVDELFGL